MSDRTCGRTAAAFPVEHCQQAPTPRHSLCFTRDMAARLLLLVGVAAAVSGLFGTVLYFFQPWRTCPDCARERRPIDLRFALPDDRFFAPSLGEGECSFVRLDGVGSFNDQCPMLEGPVRAKKKQTSPSTPGSLSPPAGRAGARRPPRAADWSRGHPENPR